MKVEPFLVEQFMNSFEKSARLNLAETCVDPFTLQEFLDFVGESDFLTDLGNMKLTYGAIEGSEDLRAGLARLYSSLDSRNILVCGGAIGANFLVFYSLVEPGDTVISVFPAYQQLYSVAKSFGANVKLLPLREKNSWLPEINELSDLLDDKTKLIVINNPHNPTGSLIESDLLEEICALAEHRGIYILSDESYRGLFVDPAGFAPSAVDISENAIATGSFSKPFSLAGLRLGWIAAKKEVIEECMLHRDYTTISQSMIADALASIAVKHVEKIFARSIRILRLNHLTMSRWIKEEGTMSWIPPRGGSSAFLRYSFNMPSKELCHQLLKKKGVLIVPGCCFGTEGFFRVGYGCRTETLNAGLARFKDFLLTLDLSE
ncbi:MAG: aminotransferase class I/II-fold pyridoxal phosphate-dependent enzyme [Candidatus Bathyarchaeota archaeon]|nr:aminotransferase class I/II-fold pyridoxal phosphate-dependent enzyme [Candidatus Bathyarchaeota archaeon]